MKEMFATILKKMTESSGIDRLMKDCKWHKWKKENSVPFLQIMNFFWNDVRLYANNPT